MCYNAFIENRSLLTDLGTTESELKKSADYIVKRSKWCNKHMNFNTLFETYALNLG